MDNFLNNFCTFSNPFFWLVLIGMFATSVALFMSLFTGECSHKR